MKYTAQQIVFQEIPDQISLSYLISGCTLRCADCHSADSWKTEAGQLLTEEKIMQDLHKYKDWITCVLFMGGEWHLAELTGYLHLIQKQGLLTALYSGQDQIPHQLLQHLDYLKLGPYEKSRGGLQSPTTNQYLMEVKTGKIIKGNRLINDNMEVMNDSLK